MKTFLSISAELMETIFTQAIGLVLAENQRVLHAIDYLAVEQLAQKIAEVDRIFVIGEGRSGLAGIEPRSIAFLSSVKVAAA